MLCMHRTEGTVHCGVLCVELNGQSASGQSAHMPPAGCPQALTWRSVRAVAARRSLPVVLQAGGLTLLPLLPQHHTGPADAAAGSQLDDQGCSLPAWQSLCSLPPMLPHDATLLSGTLLGPATHIHGFQDRGPADVTAGSRDDDQVHRLPWCPGKQAVPHSQCQDRVEPACALGQPCGSLHPAACKRSRTPPSGVAQLRAGEQHVLLCL